MDHHDECKGFEEVVAKQTEKLETSVKETKSKMAAYAEGAYSYIDEAWRELKEQQDRANRMLLEKYEKYQASLEECFKESLDEVNSLFEEQKLKLSNTFKNEVIDHERYLFSLVLLSG